MATVLVPGTDRVQASFVGVAKHYGVSTLDYYNNTADRGQSLAFVATSGGEVVSALGDPDLPDATSPTCSDQRH